MIIIILYIYIYNAYTIYNSNMIRYITKTLC